MNLDIIFHKVSEKNDYARSQVLLKIFNKISSYRRFNVKEVSPNTLKIDQFRNSTESINSLTLMTIVNRDNNKAIILNMGPRVYGTVLPGHGFDHLHVVQIIGGSSISKQYMDNAPQYIQDKLQKIRVPFTFPLDKTYQEDIALNFNIDRRSTKIKQAIFIGNTTNLPGRVKLTSILNKHPYIKIIHKERDNGGIPFKDYLLELNKYKLSISLNGFAEICYRDWESMSIGLPIVRSELYSPYYEELKPDIHYIKGSDTCNDGMIGYKESYENIAEQFITKIEEVIDNDLLLNTVGINGLNYFKRNIPVDVIVDKFFHVVDLELLK